MKRRVQRLLPLPHKPAAARIALIFAVIGPGLIAANAGNDAGGIATYASAGARYGFGLLWCMIPMAVSLVVIQDMAARMGVVTGKGFAELIREQYGVRWAVFSAVTVVAANVGLCISEFVGIGAAAGLAGIPVWISVPVTAIAIWWLLVRGSYRSAERVFIGMTVTFFAYPVAVFLAHPHWGSVATAIVAPHIHMSNSYLLLIVALTGTTITPFMLLYLQSASVDRGFDVEDLRSQRIDAASGAIFAALIAAFIVVATGATLHASGVHSIDSAADAARALRPLAGRYAELLFGVGLFGASMLAAAILPVTTAYVVAEVFGFEKGLAHRPSQAPVFMAVITFLIVVGAIVAIIPGVPVIGLLVGVQVLNGILLPVTLFFAWRLTGDESLMGEHRSRGAWGVIAFITVIVTCLLSVAAIVAAIV